MARPSPSNKAPTARPKSAQFDTFLSYSSKDKAVASRVEEGLEKRSITVWRDQEQIAPGDIFVDRLQKGLTESASMTLLISPDSLQSRWVGEERAVALSATKNPNRNFSLFPVLIKDAELEPFLSIREWVDLRQEDTFEANLDRLAAAIRASRTKRPSKSLSAPRHKLLDRLSFLAFFRDGLVRSTYQCLAQELLGEEGTVRAEAAQLLQTLTLDRVERVALAGKFLEESHRKVQMDAPLAGKILAVLVDTCFVENDPFDSSNPIGYARAVLLRDLVLLARATRPRGEREWERRDAMIDRVLSKLPYLKENLADLALEIVELLSSTERHWEAGDRLMFAQVYANAGKLEEALGIYDLYRGSDFFGDAELSVLSRAAAISDWAKAMKTSGRARAAHQEVLRGYQEAIALTRDLRAQVSSDTEAPLLEADLLNNRATQIAIYGAREEWADASRDLRAAAEIYRGLGENERLVETYANLASHSIDKEPTLSNWQSLWNELTALDAMANTLDAGTSRFFFVYQKARLAKRLLSADPALAVRLYEEADQIAQEANLPHLAALARRWSLELHYSPLRDLSEQAYLDGLEACADTMRDFVKNAWVANALRDVLLSISTIQLNRGQQETAWQTLSETFSLQERIYRRSSEEGSVIPFRRTLSQMDKVKIPDGKRDEFLKVHADTMRVLLNKPGKPIPTWNDLSRWLA